MTRRLSPVRVLGLVALILLAADSRLFRADPQAQDPETLRSLLVEVKGLRAAMEQLASAGPRVQLAFGRLQLQEQRINGFVRRLETVREKIRPAVQEEETLKNRLAAYEAAAKGHSMPEEERDQLEKQMPALRAEAGRAAAARQQLQSEEASLLSEIALEQGRWTDINRRLEELEQSLIRR